MSKNEYQSRSCMYRTKRQVPFLRNLVREAKGQQRDALLRAANPDQINAVSKMVLKALTIHKFPIRPDYTAWLRPHKETLRKLKNKKNSVKRRPEASLKQKGGISGTVWIEYVALCTYDALFDNPFNDLEKHPGMNATYATHVIRLRLVWKDLKR